MESAEIIEIKFLTVGEAGKAVVVLTNPGVQKESILDNSRVLAERAWILGCAMPNPEVIIGNTSAALRLVD